MWKLSVISAMLCGLVVLVLPAQAAGDPPHGRPRVPLAGAWRSQYTPQITDAPGADWQAVTLPATRTLPKGSDALWCEREVTVPAAWQGRRVALHIGKVQFAAAAYINDQRAGEILGYGGALDITALVRYGQPNRIRLFFGRGARGIASTDIITRTIVEHLEQQIARGGYDWGANEVGVNCLPDQFYLESQPRDVLISDVWYRTYTRGGARIDPQVTLTATRPLDNLKLRVLIYDDEQQIVRQQEHPLARLHPGENLDSAPIAADRLKLWGIHTPNLYRGQVILLDGNGFELDRSEPTTFGIREIWLNGKDIMLNGVKAQFVSDMGYQKLGSEENEYTAGITLTYGRQPIPGLCLTGNHESMAVNCDRLGMGLMTHGVTVHWLELQNPEVQRAYRAWTLEHLKRERNHPSILSWGLGINIGGNYLDFSPTTIGRQSNIDWTNTPAAIGNLITKEIDPTRPTYFHGGPRSGDICTGNIYFNHTPTQEVEDWLLRWRDAGDRPVIPVEFSGTQLTVDFVKDGMSFTTEYAARQAGDAAYAEEKDENIAYQCYDMPRQKSIWDYCGTGYSPIIVQQIIDGHRRTYRAWRYEGAPVLGWIFNPAIYAKGKEPQAKYDGERAIWQAYLDLIKPIQFWIGGPADDYTAKDHLFYAGDRIEKSLLLMRDLPDRDTWKIAWAATVGDAAVAHGSFEKVLAPFAHQCLPFAFTAPEVKAPTAVALTVTVADAGGKAIGRDTFALTIYPRPGVAPATLQAAITDPEGETTAWLRARGLDVTPFDPAAPRKPGVLILGRRALRGLRTLPISADDVEKGMRVVIFEQQCDELANLGFRHEDRAPRNVFLRQPAHPLVAGLTNEALRDWRGKGTLISEGPDGDRIASATRLFRASNRGTVASAIIETPQHGPFMPILDCEFDLGYTPLLSWRHGAGEVIFCQLDLTGRVGHDPAATQIADNLIAYLQRPLTTAQDREAVAMSEETSKRIAALGFASTPRPKTLDPKRHLLVASAADTEVCRRNRALMQNFVRHGGDLLVLGADQAWLQAADLAGIVKLSPMRASRAARTVEAHPLLTGVGPQQLHWRTPVDLQTVSCPDTRFTRLLNGGLGILATDKGRVLFLQIDDLAMRNLTAVKDLDPLRDAAVKDDWHLKNRKRSLWQVARLQSLLLTNLGVRSDPALAERLFTITRAMPFTPINGWVYLGPFPPGDNNDPLARDLTPYLQERSLTKSYTNARNERVEWYIPTDSQNGMGINGKMDLSRAYGVHLYDVAAAVTQVWSSRDREAVMEVGADWWLKIDVNGKTYFRTGTDGSWGLGFHNQITVPLKQGWNDIVATVGAGTNGHLFWCRISNPGDLVVAQRPAAPADPPQGLPTLESLIPENAAQGFSFYTGAILPGDDPYLFIPW